MSQKELAESMRSLGFRWSQATVWSIEKGERPLRLIEADAVAFITNSSVSELLRPGVSGTLRAVANEAVLALGQIADVLGTHRGSLERVADDLDARAGAEVNPGDLSGLLRSAGEEIDLFDVRTQLLVSKVKQLAEDLVVRADSVERERVASLRQAHVASPPTADESADGEH
jgi:hypothetical protein